MGRGVKEGEGGRRDERRGEGEGEERREQETRENTRKDRGKKGRGVNPEEKRKHDMT